MAENKEYKHPHNPNELIYGQKLHVGMILLKGDVFASTLSDRWLETTQVGSKITDDGLVYVRPAILQRTSRTAD